MPDDYTFRMWELLDAVFASNLESIARCLQEQVFLAVESIDLRMGTDGLSLRVQQSLSAAPGSGHAFVFRNHRGNRLKLLIWYGAGVWH